MKGKLLLLKCITNLHVGNGDVSFNLVDREVERDPVTNYPTVNGSGIKGALREFFVSQAASQQFIDQCFGGGTASQGRLKIMSADLLAMPGRVSRGESPYALLTTRTALDRFTSLHQLFLGRPITLPQLESQQDFSVEGVALSERLLLQAGNLTQQLYPMQEQDFSQLSLPVLGRNRLDSGRLSSLWFEEVVPHQALFFVPVAAADSDAPLLETFAAGVDGQILQIGSGSSIGYGFCQVFVVG